MISYRLIVKYYAGCFVLKVCSEGKGIRFIISFEFIVP